MHQVLGIVYALDQFTVHNIMMQMDSSPNTAAEGSEAQRNKGAKFTQLESSTVGIQLRLFDPVFYQTCSFWPGGGGARL